MKLLNLVLLAILLSSCGKQTITISNNTDSGVTNYAASELQKYMTLLYDDIEISASNKQDGAIQYLLSDQAKALDLGTLPTAKESFAIKVKEGTMYIIAPDERGLLNATYALLEKMGCGFYISGDILPEPRIWEGFAGLEMNDEPLTGDRLLFNWHNFLSGCTGWNLEDWQNWIDAANKMRYNSIMVHAYGNNPMFSFEYLGEKKQTGYLNNTASGRDWGNQHVNDVRRIVGGEIFDTPLFGSEASLVPEDKKEEAATRLMQQVFRYAKERGTKVIFALDFDSGSANPQNILKKLPKEAVFKIGGSLTPNPDHPEGYKYFEHVVKSLVEMYPEIDQLAVWHRDPAINIGHSTLWMKFPYELFPQNWKTEYKQKLKQNPDIEDNQLAIGMFAHSKLVKAIVKAKEKIKPSLKISSGSWKFGFVKYADAFYPKSVALLPLDYSIVFGKEDATQNLINAGKNREVYPIVWAHHDDHQYIGRPYTPWNNMAKRLKETNSAGFGIIHWTTRPLDLYFTSTSRQVWKQSENEALKTTIEKYVKDISSKSTEGLTDYYYNFITKGPIFGRETSNHFADLNTEYFDKNVEKWTKIETEAVKRIEVLRSLSAEKNKFLQFQIGMEEFYHLFAKNQILLLEATKLNSDKAYDKAREVLKKANPDETLQKYVEAIEHLVFTPGEKGVLYSMNMRWKSDFINLRQCLGMEDIYYKFTPTYHDPLAQGKGSYSYFIEDEDHWYRCMWKHELPGNEFVNENGKTAMIIKDKLSYPLTSMHGQLFTSGKYELKLDFESSADIECIIIEDGKEIAKTDIAKNEHNKSITFSSQGGKLLLKLQSDKSLMLMSLGIEKTK